MSDNSLAEWVDWPGGECPVDPHVTVRFKCRSGYITRPHMAGEPKIAKFWRHETGVSDIVAFKILT